MVLVEHIIEEHQTVGNYASRNQRTRVHTTTFEGGSGLSVL
jgi:hypothetical protein